MAEGRKRLTRDLLEVLDRFAEKKALVIPPLHDCFLDGNEQIKAAIAKYYAEDNKGTLVSALEVIRQHSNDGNFTKLFHTHIP